MLLTACQLTTPAQNNNVASDYYLWIKTLTTEELRQEISQQQQNYQAGFEQAKINLILLHALTTSPVYNPYTAKTMLNNFTSERAAQQLTAHDFALLSLLRDQLNQYILASNKLLLSKQKQQEHSIQQQQVIEEKQTTIDKLQQQINQLKRIELTIENEQ
ncbi:hypothetical protein tinsulaeT_25740 [Thalassotalea insulae]|uniref:Uncharacterized protein n=2 Tax=Thalassotalea insulae TaxID=2056778 RepID=A0ABQ6GV54_9GAMM|nr:hypothetical protein tinsulaeT_25740 [Thalassotalea insulae]